MSDNVAATPGVGVSLAFDEVSGVQYQRVKVNFGVDGAAADVTGAVGLPVSVLLGGAVVASANPFPVTALPATPIPSSPGLKTTEQLSRIAISCNSSGANTLLAGVSLQYVRIYAIIFTVASPVNVKLGDTTVTDFTGAMTFGVGGGLLLTQQGEPHFITAIGKGVNLNLSSAVQCSGVMWYQQGV